MKAAIAAVVVLASIGVARAAPGHIVEDPGGWRAEPEQASALAQRLAAVPRALPTQTAVEAYSSDGVAMIATRTTITLPSEPAARGAALSGAIRAALDELRGAPKRASLAGDHAAEQAWDAQVDLVNKQIDALLMWADDGSKATVSARGRIASDGAVLVVATAECIAAEASKRATGIACERALHSLDPGIALDRRVALAIPPAAAQAPAQAPLPDASMSAPPSLSDGMHIVLPPQHIPQPPPAPDRRPVYVGFGVVLLAAMFWWNRRQRDRFEREDAGEARPRRRERVTVSSRRIDRDHDADDLHAAARGDRPEDDA